MKTSSLLAVLFCGVLMGCGGVTGTLNPPSDPTDPPPPAGSTLSVSPTSVTFGDVAVGSSSSVSLTLTNSGGSSIEISSFTITGEFQISGLTTPATLGAAASSTVSVTFSPTVAGATGAGDGINVISTADNSPVFVALSGTGTTDAPPPPPAAPSGLSAGVASNTQIDLSWTDNSSDEDGFRVYRSTDDINFSQIAELGADATAFSNTGLSASTTYYYYVTTFNGSGESAASNTASATTDAPPPPPSGGDPVLSYSADTSATVKAEPALPNPGSAGTVFTDPTFGTRILRVTDINTGAQVSPGFATRSWRSPASSEANVFNADTTRFYAQSSGSPAIIYNFNKANFSASIDTSVPPDFTGRVDLVGLDFSHAQPDIIYGIRDPSTSRTLAQFDFSTGLYTDLLVADVCPGISVAFNDDTGQVTASADNDGDGQDDRLAFATGGQGQNNWTVAIVWDRNQGCRWFNISTDEIGGEFGPPCVNCAANNSSIHNVRISRDGKFLYVAPTSGNGMIWEIDTTTARFCDTAGCEGHRSWGWIDGVPSLFNGSANWRTRPATDPNNSTLITLRLDSAASHNSWNNARVNLNVPVIVDTYGGDPSTAHDHEIIAIAIDGSGTIWRFAHNRTDPNTGNFWDTPRGNVSRDGCYFVFTSNWELTLGTNDQGMTRQDIFLLELSSACAAN